eukprot:1415575-Prymnesium_polylepis.1
MHNASRCESCTARSLRPTGGSPCLEVPACAQWLACRSCCASVSSYTPAACRPPCLTPGGFQTTNLGRCPLHPRLLKSQTRTRGASLP